MISSVRHIPDLVSHFQNSRLFDSRNMIQLVHDYLSVAVSLLLLSLGVSSECLQALFVRPGTRLHARLCLSPSCACQFPPWSNCTIGPHPSVNYQRRSCVASPSVSYPWGMRPDLRLAIETSGA